MIFSPWTGGNIENLIPQLKLNELIIEQVTELNFLGLTVNQQLTWNEHVQDIKITWDYVQIKSFLPQQVLRILYNSLILPHLQYCILLWGFKSGRLFK